MKMGHPSPKRLQFLTTLLLLGMGVALCVHPFTRSIDYPLALASALPFSLVLGIVGVMLSRAYTTGQAVLHAIFLLLIGAAALLAPPAAVSFLSRHMCEPLQGLLFFLLGPVCSGLVSVVCGIFIGRIFRRRWVALLIFSLILIGSLAIPLVEFMLTPMVRFYGTFFGMYHGAVYDEAVFVEMPYLILRLWNLTGVATLISLLFVVDQFHAKSKGFLHLRRRCLLFAAAAVGALVFIALAAFLPRLGVTGSTAYLNAKLSRTLETSRFVLHFAPQGRAERAAPLLTRELEFQADRLTDLFGLPPLRRRIDVYIYEDARSKGALMGAARTSIAKPWLRQLHVHTHTPDDSLLAHELAHVMLAELSTSPLGVPTAFGFVPLVGIMEGAAVAAEKGGDILTTHQWARAMRDIGRTPNLEEILLGVRFWTRSAPLAYTASGSFISFLLEEFGPGPFSCVYAGGSFEDAYHRSLSDLIAAWDSFLDLVPISPSDLELAELVFSRPPVFEKVCPFAGGRCLAQAALALEEGRPKSIPALAKKGVNLTAYDFSLSMKFVRLLYAAGEPMQGLDLLRALCSSLPNDVGVAFLSQTELARADGLWLAGRQEEAHALYRKLALGPATRWLGPALTFRTHLSLMPDAPPVIVTSAHTWNEGEHLARELLSRQDSLSPLLRVRLAFTLAGYPSLFRHAISLLETNIDSLGEPLEELVHSARFLLARLYAYEERLDEAAATLASLSPRTPAERESFSLWSDRISWQLARSGLAKPQPGVGTK